MPTMNVDKMTFIHIPKTAGSAVTVWYIKNILKKNPMYYEFPIVDDHIFISEIENPAPITISIVRNPWDRVVSMYSFLQQINNMKFKKFSEFVLNDMKVLTFSKYLLSTPQIRWIEPGVTHLLRFENLEQDFRIIQDIFQCYEPLPVWNKTNHYHYRMYYNDETRQAVAEMFKEDIEAFGYEF